MKKLIRKGVFETNSSSCHSITISHSNTLNDTIYPDSDGKIELIGGEFGWEVEDYNDPLTKANYCAQDIVQNQYPVTEEIVFNSEEKKEMLVKVIKEHTGCNEVVFNALELNNGYIDHQSYGETSEAFSSEENLKNFIFNPGSNLHLDNDNH